MINLALQKFSIDHQGKFGKRRWVLKDDPTSRVIRTPWVYNMSYVSLEPSLHRKPPKTFVSEPTKESMIIKHHLKVDYFGDSYDISSHIKHLIYSSIYNYWSVKGSLWGHGMLIQIFILVSQDLLVTLFLLRVN